MKKLFSLKGRKHLRAEASLVSAQAYTSYTHHETILVSQNIGLDGDADRYALDANYRIVVS